MKKDYNNNPEKNNEAPNGGIKEQVFWIALFLIVLMLVGIFIQNFYIMKYENKIAFSGRTSSAGIENPKSWEEVDEKTLDDFDIEGPENDTASKEIKDSSERTFTTKPYEEVTTTATTTSSSMNVTVSEDVIREAKVYIAKLIEETCGERIAIYAREFYKEYQGKVNYGVNFKLRKKAYWLIPEDDGTFTVDCVGLVNLVVHNATGFTLEDEGEYTGFVVPEGNIQEPQVCKPFEFQDVIYDFHPGDILTIDGHQHEVIYIGNDEILDITPSNGLEIKNVHEYKYSKRAQIIGG